MMYNKNDPSTIQDMFDSIAERYDRANAFLSFNLHKRWNKKLIDEVGLLKKSHNFLDLCCGTGDIALGYLSGTTATNNAFLVDFSENMLSCAKKKLSNRFARCAIHYVQADVQKLPLPSNSIDRATMAYGIRNVKNPTVCLNEIYRTLKSGGQLGILELTQPKQLILRYGHQFYLKAILPLLGRMITSNQAAYQYLQNSIRTFISPIELEKMLLHAGFKQTKTIPLAGGIATILIGSKT